MAYGPSINLEVRLDVNILRRIFGSPLSPSWEFDPGSLVWKLQPTSGGLLAGEARDVERKTMSLFSIDPRTGQTRFKGLTLDEPWWIALEMTIGDIAILHRYPKPDMPNAIGATAIDCMTGETLWSNGAIRVLCGVEEIALIQRGDSFNWQQLALIDVRSGEIIEEIGGSPERVGEFQQACERVTITGEWINSEPVQENDPDALQLAKHLATIVKEQRGDLESARYGPYLVASVHDRSRRSAESMLSGTVDAHLLVVHDDKVVFHDILTKDAPGASSDNFFIWNGMLMFIHDRRLLRGINLDKE